MPLSLPVSLPPFYKFQTLTDVLSRTHPNQFRDAHPTGNVADNKTKTHHIYYPTPPDLYSVYVGKTEIGKKTKPDIRAGFEILQTGEGPTP